MRYIKLFKSYQIFEKNIIDKDQFLLYEFSIDGIDFFVRFYERIPGIWRRGYWFKEKNYFLSNIEKINKRLQSESNPRIINRLENELDYFNNNIHYKMDDLLGKTKNPLKIINAVSDITIDFLKRKELECDCLEIHHMRTGDEDVSARLKLTKRSIVPKLDLNIWDYDTIKSTSLIFKTGLNLDKLELEIY